MVRVPHSHCWPIYRMGNLFPFTKYVPFIMYWGLVGIQLVVHSESEQERVRERVSMSETERVRERERKQERERVKVSWV